MFGFLKRGKNRKWVAREADVPSQSKAPEIDPNSALAHNQQLFDKLNSDIESGTLARVRKPSRHEIASCEERRRKELERAQADYDAEEEHEPWGAIYVLKRVQANQEIPVADELWVDIVCEHYLGTAKPMMGMAHWYSDVRKRLYASRGYTWYSKQDIYPLVIFD